MQKIFFLYIIDIVRLYLLKTLTLIIIYCDPVLVKSIIEMIKKDSLKKSDYLKWSQNPLI